MNDDNLLYDIYSELKALGFVSNQYEFSQMCGRTPTWFSAIKSRRLQITSDAFLTLVFNIDQKAATILDEIKHHRAVRLSNTLMMQAQRQAALKASVRNGTSWMVRPFTSCGD